MLNFIKIFISIIISIFTVLSQNVNISGTVKNNNEEVIPNAIVILEDLNLQTNTDENGNFNIYSVPISHNFINNNINLDYSIKNGIMELNLKQNSKLKLYSYTLQGKLILNISKNLQAGISSISLQKLKPGIYIHKLKINSKEFIIKNVHYNQLSASNLSQNKRINRRQLIINDNLKVLKDGYLDYRIDIKNYDTNNLEITLHPSAGELIDYDGNKYQTVKIGDQIWTAENLRVTHYNDGTPIPKITDSTEWINDTSGAYCYYKNDSLFLTFGEPSNFKYFGAIYNSNAIQTGKIAPEGWHVPTKTDWQTLINYLIENGYNWDSTKTENKIAKSLASKTGWTSNTGFLSNGEAGKYPYLNNKTGFNGMPAGYRNYAGKFNAYYARWWSSSKSVMNEYYAYMIMDDFEYLKQISNDANTGNQIRLIKD